MDSGIPGEQDAASLPIAVVLLRAKSNTIDQIKPLLPRLLVQLADLRPRSLVVVRS